jgi:hypothetical protein
VLHNAGAAALARNDAGPAVAFLLAARRLDPRAADIGRNLELAASRAAAARGADPVSPGLPVAPVSAREAWWLAAALVVAGALLASRWRLAHAPGPRAPARRRLLLLAGHAPLVAGLALGAALALHAREEAVHPEAVVVAPSLAAGPAPNERPRPPYLLGAGEIVRLGRTRGALVELLVSGTPIGWAERAGVWRVDEVARYTAAFTEP